MTERTLTFGSLFAGVGGIDLGFERAGMQCKWQVEIDDDAGRVLDMHWPNVRRFKDVREVGKHNLEAVDVICGGFPCFPGGTLILTRDGFKAIEDVRKGDLVLTHKNRWQPVTSTMKREGETIVLKGQGHPGLETTDEHLFGPWKRSATTARSRRLTGDFSRPNRNGRQRPRWKGASGPPRPSFRRAIRLNLTCGSLNRCRAS